MVPYRKTKDSKSLPGLRIGELDQMGYKPNTCILLHLSRSPQGVGNPDYFTSRKLQRPLHSLAPLDGVPRFVTPFGSLWLFDLVVGILARLNMFYLISHCTHCTVPYFILIIPIPHSRDSPVAFFHFRLQIQHS